ncbi:hypothetical protein [Ramlibacter sp. AN1133]|uniref:hypothetical protein n=1 Tax=Ramlibacter sp. AN1133 TaxID=3133429 RepID=UPI0030BA4894
MPITKPSPVTTPVQPVIAPVRPVHDIDLPKSLFIDHAGLRLHIDWKALCGKNPSFNYEVPLAPATNAPLLDVTQFRRINVMISGTQSSASMYLGKLDGSHCCEVNTLPIDNRIHSFEVTGPHMRIYLHGTPALGVEDVQLWVYLRS